MKTKQEFFSPPLTNLDGIFYPYTTFHLLHSLVRVLHSPRRWEVMVWPLTYHYQRTKINASCKAIFLELCRISHISPLLTGSSTKKVMSAYVGTRVDYSNSMLVELPHSLLNERQRAPNHKILNVLRNPKSDHVTSLFRELHSYTRWLQSERTLLPLCPLPWPKRSLGVINTLSAHSVSLMTKWSIRHTLQNKWITRGRGK